MALFSPISLRRPPAARENRQPSRSGSAAILPQHSDSPGAGTVISRAAPGLLEKIHRFFVQYEARHEDREHLYLARRPGHRHRRSIDDRALAGKRSQATKEDLAEFRIALAELRSDMHQAVRESTKWSC